MGKLQNIQFLRGLAAILVVCTHLTASVSARALESAGVFFLDGVFTVGGFGVDIFFVISGFIMVYISSVRTPSSRINFFIRRVVRIYPIYWVCSLVLLIFFLLPYTKVAPPDSMSTIKSFLLYPELNLEGNVRPSLVGQGWTLIFEMYFYCIFSLAALFSLRSKMLTVISIITTLFVIANIVDLGVFSHVLGNTLVFEFLLGMYIGYLKVKGFEFAALKYRVCCVVLVFLTLGLVFFSREWWGSLDRFLSRGVPAFLLVTWMVLDVRVSRVRISRLWQTLGDASYSIYLTHMIGVLVLSVLWKRDFILGPSLFDVMPLDIYFFVSLVLICIFGVLFYRLIEKPLTDVLNALVQRKLAVSRLYAPSG